MRLLFGLMVTMASTAPAWATLEGDLEALSDMGRVYCESQFTQPADVEKCTSIQLIAVATMAAFRAENPQITDQKIMDCFSRPDVMIGDGINFVAATECIKD